MAAEAHAERSEALRQIADDAPNYQGYQPLDSSRQEIRVLDLEADLTCTLRHVDLSASPTYHALSYCWGPPSSTRALTIKSAGTDEAEIVQIRKTLAKFLKSLYKQYGRITVWLDVICIDQRSFAEQNAQVAMMGDIYRSAKSVYAWVGPWDPDVEYFFDFAGAISLNEVAPEYDLKKIELGLDLLFCRPYWTRVWIIQECVLNQRLILICGPLAISWETLEAGVEQALNSVKAGDSASELFRDRFKVLQQARAHATSVPDTSIIEEALHFKQAQCTDPHDKIYGFRALATIGSDLQVDYSCKLFDLLVATVSLQNRVRCQSWQLNSKHQANPCHTWWKDCETLPSENENMLSDGSGLSNLMSLGAPEILEALQAQPGDWLVMPVGQIDFYSARSDKSIDETCGLTFEEVRKTASAYLIHRGRNEVFSYNNYDLRNTLVVFVLDDGHIVSLEDGKGIISSGPFRAIDPLWVGHIWVCNVHRAVHVSRWLYAMLMAREAHNLSGSRWELESYFKSKPRATPPRYCGCNRSPITPYPSPWPAKRDDDVQNKSAIS